MPCGYWTSNHTFQKNLNSFSEISADLKIDNDKMVYRTDFVGYLISSKPLAIEKSYISHLKALIHMF